MSLITKKLEPSLNSNLELSRLQLMDIGSNTAVPTRIHNSNLNL